MEGARNRAGRGKSKWKVSVEIGKDMVTGRGGKGDDESQGMECMGKKTYNKKRLEKKLHTKQMAWKVA